MRERIYQMLEGDGKGSIFYDRFMLICIVCSIVPLCFKEITLLFLWIERTTAGVFIVDYLLRWMTADLKYRGKRFPFLRYPFGFFAIVDLISILPYIRLLHRGFRLLRVLRLLRLSRVLRALKLLRYSRNFMLILGAVKREKKSLAAVCVVAVGYVLLCALIMFQAEPDSFGSFLDAAYWAVITLTTIGYGDIYPVSEVGKVVSMISAFVGVAVVALPTGIITAGYMSELNKNEQNKNELNKNELNKEEESRGAFEK